jgi:hypothetical protein
MLGALICCWVQLAGVLGGEKTYSGSSIIIKIYPALSLAIGGRDGVDGGGGQRITCSNYRIMSSVMPLGRFLAFGGGFGWGYEYYINRTIRSGMFLGMRGGGMRQESVWERVPEVGPSQLGKRCQLGFGFGYWARLGAVFDHKKDVFGFYYTNKNLHYPFRGYWGTGWDGCRRGTLDDVVYK